MENKKVNIVLFIILIIIIIAIIILIGRYNEEIAKKAEDIIQNTITPVLTGKDTNIKEVPTMEEKIKGNTMWCGTFQMIWNDLKTDIVKQDIEFSPQLYSADNLNKSKFNSSMISNNDYYKIYGKVSEELKNQINTDLANKFGETSDFINNFNWNNNSSNSKYLLYSILKKNLKFTTPFNDLEKADFAGKTKNVSYFGLKENSNPDARSQINVLYYKNENDKAISISTTSNDEIILCRTNTLQNFNQVFQKINNEASSYSGNKNMEDSEILMIPEIKVKVDDEFSDLENRDFKNSNGDTLQIDKAIQSIEFELNKEGAKVVSEAGMAVGVISLDETEKRDFSFNNEFVMFMKEKDKELPYFAINVSDITAFQK